MVPILRTGRDGHTEADYEGSASDEEVAWGELRQVMAGTTSIVGGDDGIDGLLRNLDSLQEALDVGRSDLTDEECMIAKTVCRVLGLGAMRPEGGTP